MPARGRTTAPLIGNVTWTDAFVEPGQLRRCLGRAVPINGMPSRIV
jgi:hypothetical protein